jgi:hypothetical protein
MFSNCFFIIDMRASALLIEISNIAKSVLIVLDLTPASKLRMRSIFACCLVMNRSSDAMSCLRSSNVFKTVAPLLVFRDATQHQSCAAL